MMEQETSEDWKDKLHSAIASNALSLIMSGEIEYTNDGINKLIEYYKKKEDYEVCGDLIALLK